jgi:hypothetical protein
LNNYDQGMIEEALFVYKLLPKQIAQLEIEMDCIFPPSPGSVLKMVGRPQAKAPQDTSQTESWGIHRATCQTAILLAAKILLRSALRGMAPLLSVREKEYVYLKYGKELHRLQVQRRMNIGSSGYYFLNKQVISKAEAVISLNLSPQMLDLALQWEDYESTGGNNLQPEQECFK